jgi:hypothetical protein
MRWLASGWNRGLNLKERHVMMEITIDEAEAAKGVQDEIISRTEHENTA